MSPKHLLYALRHLSRHKLNTTINILGLTLGVLSCLVIYLFVTYEFSYDKFHPDGSRIYRVTSENINPKGDHSMSTGMAEPLAADLRRETSGWTTVTGFALGDSRVIISD